MTELGPRADAASPSHGRRDHEFFGYHGASAHDGRTDRRQVDGPGFARRPASGLVRHLADHYPAVIILTIPLGFRLTCYYYREAYYRSWWLSPPACAVPDSHKRYTGETRFPLILQNIHRYFLYAALVFNVILSWVAIIAFDWHGTFGMGLGTLVMLADAVHCGSVPTAPSIILLKGAHHGEQARGQDRPSL